MESAERLHVGVFHDRHEHLSVAELGHVLEQKKSEDQLGVFGRPSDGGKVLEIFPFELRPGDEFGDLQPPVPLIQSASERKKFGEKNIRVTVFRLVHAAELRWKVHGFRWGVGKKRAFGALNRSAVCHIFIMLSIDYMELEGFSANPK